MYMGFNILQQERIIIVMGPTGAGKSSFIAMATGQADEEVGHGLVSQTSNIRSVTCSHPGDRHPVVFVDTPGFDDTFKSDVEILSMIAEWLVTTYQKKIKLAGIVYLHRISDNRMTGTALKNLHLFEGVCGKDAMPNVILVTTMWDEVKTEVGIQRETELRETFWKEFLDNGCQTLRFAYTPDSAWTIIGNLLQDHQAPLQLPKDIVDRHLPLNMTAAGIALRKELDKLIKDQKDAKRRIEEQVRKQSRVPENEPLMEVLNEQKEEIEDKIRKTAEQLQVMKITLPQKIQTFLSSLRIPFHKPRAMTLDSIPGSQLSEAGSSLRIAASLDSDGVKAPIVTTHHDDRGTVIDNINQLHPSGKDLQATADNIQEMVTYGQAEAGAGQDIFGGREGIQDSQMNPNLGLSEEDSRSPDVPPSPLSMEIRFIADWAKEVVDEADELPPSPLSVEVEFIVDECREAVRSRLETPPSPLVLEIQFIADRNKECVQPEADTSPGPPLEMEFESL